MVTVNARSWDSRHATLKAWQRAADGTWSLAARPVPRGDRLQRLGRRGRPGAEHGHHPGRPILDAVRLRSIRRSGARLDYRRVDGDDWWPYEPRDPATYNVYQFHKAQRTHWRHDKAEHLDSYTTQYGYAIVVGFNLPGRIHYSAARRQWVADDRA